MTTIKVIAITVSTNYLDKLKLIIKIKIYFINGILLHPKMIQIQSKLYY